MPDARSLGAAWPSDLAVFMDGRDVLLLGETHGDPEMSNLLLHNLPALKRAGVRHVFVEVAPDRLTEVTGQRPLSLREIATRCHHSGYVQVIAASAAQGLSVHGMDPRQPQDPDFWPTLNEEMARSIASRMACGGRAVVIGGSGHLTGGPDLTFGGSTGGHCAGIASHLESQHLQATAVVQVGGTDWKNTAKLVLEGPKDPHRKALAASMIERAQALMESTGTHLLPSPHTHVPALLVVPRPQAARSSGFNHRRSRELSAAAQSYETGASRGDPLQLLEAALMRELNGESETARSLYRQAVQQGVTGARMAYLGFLWSRNQLPGIRTGPGRNRPHHHGSGITTRNSAASPALRQTLQQHVPPKKAAAAQDRGFMRPT